MFTRQQLDELTKPEMVNIILDLQRRKKHPVKKKKAKKPVIDARYRALVEYGRDYDKLQSGPREENPCPSCGRSGWSCAYCRYN